MIWATGAVIHLDPAACAWVIRRDVDPAAEFVFLDDDPPPPGATLFDAPGADLARGPGPNGDECAFESVLRHFDLIDPTLWLLAEIVHEAVLVDHRFHAPEAIGLDAVVDGLALIGDDEHTLTVTRPLFDGLYRRFYSRSLLGQERHNPFW